MPKEGLSMASKVKRNAIDFNEKMVNIIIVMHKQSWRLTALVEGEVALDKNFGRFRRWHFFFYRLDRGGSLQFLQRFLRRGFGC
jgi:hypothetical protein